MIVDNTDEMEDPLENLSMDELGLYIKAAEQTEQIARLIHPNQVKFLVSKMNTNFMAFYEKNQTELGRKAIEDLLTFLKSAHIFIKEVEV